MPYWSYFSSLDYLVYPVFLNLFCLLQVLLIISDISQNIFLQATKNSPELVGIIFLVQKKQRVALFFINTAYYPSNLSENKALLSISGHHQNLSQDVNSNIYRSIAAISEAKCYQIILWLSV